MLSARLLALLDLPAFGVFIVSFGSKYALIGRWFFIGRMAPRASTGVSCLRFRLRLLIVLSGVLSVTFWGSWLVLSTWIVSLWLCEGFSKVQISLELRKVRMEHMDKSLWWLLMNHFCTSVLFKFVLVSRDIRFTNCFSNSGIKWNYILIVWPLCPIIRFGCFNMV